jgi:hypothetical protein
MVVDLGEKESTTLAQWQTCVEMANSVSQRRDTMNNLFVSLNIAIIAATSIMWDIKSIIVSTGGIFICMMWWMFIMNFKILNEAKFRIILELESKLPEQPFSDEWKYLKAKKGYRNGTKIECILPITFLIIYIITITVIVILKIGGNI